MDLAHRCSASSLLKELLDADLAAIMATTTATPPVTSDTLITVKVLIDGSTRKFKLPLNNLTVTILPEKVRLLLHFYYHVDCCGSCLRRQGYASADIVSNSCVTFWTSPLIRTSNLNAIRTVRVILSFSNLRIPLSTRHSTVQPKQSLSSDFV